MMVGNNLKEQKIHSKFYPDKIPGVNLEIENSRLTEKVRPSEDPNSSGINKTCRLVRSFPLGNADVGAEKGSLEEELKSSKFLTSASSSKHCSLRDKSPFKKFRRNNRCKYCRRLLGSPTSLLLTRGAKTLSPPPQPPFIPRTNTRRPLESPLDEVAWACGRLWCSVGRRKRRKISENRQRKQINEAFSTLREILPPAAQTEYEDSAAAKVSTLRLAASYIQALSDLLRDTHLSERSNKGAEKDMIKEDEEGKNLLKGQEKTSSILPFQKPPSKEDFLPPKRGSSSATKMQKSLFKTDKKIPLVKSLSGSEAPLECV